jgi:coatomer subunit beta'
MEQGGKIIWARHNEIQTANIKSAVEGAAQVPDGERLPLSAKELGNCEVYPQKLQHNHNGRFVVVCGDGEYIIYTSLAWRNKSFGAALDFVWGPETGQYAVRESAAKIKVFKNFKEVKAFKPGYAAEGIFGGALFSVRTNSFVCFHDWEDCNVIRRIDVCPKGVCFVVYDLFMLPLD